MKQMLNDSSDSSARMRWMHTRQCRKQALLQGRSRFRSPGKKDAPALSPVPKPPPPAPKGATTEREPRRRLSVHSGEQSAGDRCSRTGRAGISATHCHNPTIMTSFHERSSKDFNFSPRILLRFVTASATINTTARMTNEALMI